MEKELLINETEAFSEILQQIREAKESIYICMYIWRDDNIGNLVAEELIKAADRGVKVEILKDKAGSVFERVEQQKQSFFHKQREVKCCIKEWFISFLYYRDNKVSKKQLRNKRLNRMLEHENITIKFNKERHDHSKFYIFDKQVLILGGMNIGDKTVAALGAQYGDYMIKLADQGLVTCFLESLAKGQPLAYQGVSFYFNMRDKKIYQIKPKVLELLDQARYRVDIEMAYFGDRDITNKIIEISRKGVNVTILTSKDANVQQALNQQVLEKIIKESNVKVYLSDRMVHSKFMCIDRRKFFLGSANFHKLGMSKLSEINVLVEGDCVCKKWEAWRKEHLKECKLVSQDCNLDYNRLIALTERVFC
ncbi:phosphatidylserine/phosphatidylglycerophosphate/cardiolipin synthase [Halobacteroides halobius DSM 5150]|uniref:Phosphatidylserine/phosphatidylglycerophosphate/ cardiolipin synthase n=1 Tax=Halobacteroides halobius (strain ATCC 35273 / DSM 5150 / MD-1) TaxID=748449 RepID=L0K8H4_HALHC|nr:phosphatidylserine/phosphatidylglycerophosphate/cardiolipin synthase family protein [Halobacteroides halobius]AGB40423.1 phosphatidylserine/phosphatidylglycerophosphate/cardiolipin synthase [Halobacteroides halobius DSM 5150]